MMVPDCAAALAATHAAAQANAMNANPTRTFMMPPFPWCRSKPKLTQTRAGFATHGLAQAKPLFQKQHFDFRPTNYLLLVARSLEPNRALSVWRIFIGAHSCAQAALWPSQLPRASQFLPSRTWPLPQSSARSRLAAARSL